MESWRGKGDRGEREDGEVESKMEKGLGRGKGGERDVESERQGSGSWKVGSREGRERRSRREDGIYLRSNFSLRRVKF